MYVIFGSSNALTPLQEIAAIWSNDLNLDLYLPIAANAYGDIFTITKDNAVHFLETRGARIPQPLCDSFEALIDEFFMGERFLELFPQGRGVSEWLELLKELGWHPS